jgi:hypothetical protein
MIARTIGLTLDYRDASCAITCVQSLDRVTVHVSNDNLGLAAGVNRGADGGDLQRH